MGQHLFTIFRTVEEVDAMSLFAEDGLTEEEESEAGEGDEEAATTLTTTLNLAGKG